MKKFGMTAALLAALGLALAFYGCSNGSDSVVNPTVGTTQTPSDGNGGGGGQPTGGGEDPGGGGENGGKTAATITFAESDVGRGVGEAAFTNALSNTGDGAVTYSSSNTGAATVDAATGQVTIVAEGTTTITATVADSETYSYAQKTAYYTLTVYPPQYMAVPLTIEPANGVTLKIEVKNAPASFKYFKDDGANVMRDFSAQQDMYNGTIQVTYPNKVCFYADMTNNKTTEANAFKLYTSNWNCYVYGNVMSLLDSQNFASKKTINVDNAFALLFKDNINMTNHPDASKPLILPAETLAKYCYYYMFSGCSSLTKAPALPAKTMAENCYDRMFENCVGLTKTPALPATNLASECYYGMFFGCDGFTDGVPRNLLPAKELAESCYKAMFMNCKNLKYMPNLPAGNLQEGCYSLMFCNCKELKTVAGLTAKTLVNNCYAMMFQGCEKLNYVACYATEISASGCLTNWLKNVAANGKFIKLNNTVPWKSGDSGIPSNWEVYTYNNQ